MLKKLLLSIINSFSTPTIGVVAEFDSTEISAVAESELTTAVESPSPVVKKLRKPRKPTTKV